LTDHETADYISGRQGNEPQIYIGDNRYRLSPIWISASSSGRDPAPSTVDAFVRARWTTTARLAYALSLDHQKAEDLRTEDLAQAALELLRRMAYRQPKPRVLSR
jgi:hypothetical protein